MNAFVSGRDFNAERNEALTFINELIGDDKAYERFLRRIGELRRTYPRHLIVPVWYLTHIEHLEKEKVLAGLVLDEDERVAVSDLYQKFSDRR
jgi:hypothetical protein